MPDKPASKKTRRRPMWAVIRTTGAGSDAEGWREGCEHCLRRTSPPVDPDRVLWTTPPAIIVFECECLIETKP